jgi:hypothetical protein
VRHLYRGPGASVASDAAATHGASWYVVSAGLGFVHSSERVPSYDLTISGNGASSVLGKIEGRDLKRSDLWWQALMRAQGKRHPMRQLIRRRRKALFVIALSTPYLQMVQKELSGLAAEDIERIRILSCKPGALPEALRPAHMPYDGRLNGRGSPEPGPMSSFAQRAARHFLGRVLRTRRKSSLINDARSVELALKGVKKPRRLLRERVTDQEIGRLAIKLRAVGVSPSAALRHLRHNLSIACEQGRFRRIWNNSPRP